MGKLRGLMKQKIMPGIRDAGVRWRMGKKREKVEIDSRKKIGEIYPELVKLQGVLPTGRGQKKRDNSYEDHERRTFGNGIYIDEAVFDEEKMMLFLKKTGLDYMAWIAHNLRKGEFLYAEETAHASILTTWDALVLDDETTKEFLRRYEPKALLPIPKDKIGDRIKRLFTVEKNTEENKPAKPKGIQIVNPFVGERIQRDRREAAEQQKGIPKVNVNENEAIKAADANGKESNNEQREEV